MIRPAWVPFHHSTHWVLVLSLQNADPVTIVVPAAIASQSGIRTLVHGNSIHRIELACAAFHCRCRVLRNQDSALSTIVYCTVVQCQFGAFARTFSSTARRTAQVTSIAYDNA